MLAIPGVHSVPNAVKAAAVAYRLGVTPEQIDAAFRGLTITGHRQEIKRTRAVHASSMTPITPAPNRWQLASICCARFHARGLAWRSWARWARWAMRLLACMSSWAPMPPPRSSTCWRAWVVSWPSLWPMPRMMGMDEDRIQVFSDYQQVLDRMGGALEKHDVVLVKGSRFVELDRFVEGVC